MGAKAVFILLIGVLAIVIGLFLLKYSYRLSKEAKNSKSWPFVIGEVLKNDLLVIGGGLHPSYDVDLKYDYKILSKKYHGTEPHLYKISTKAEAEFIVDKFKAGNKVQVYYKPDDPQCSVLITGARKSKPYHEYASSILLIIIGIVIIYKNLDSFKEIYEAFVK